jgi:hypothetical protein
MKKVFLIFLIISVTCPEKIINAEPLPLNGPVSLPAFVQKPDSNYIEKLLNVNRFNLEIIPPSLGVQFYRNGIVFLSNTKTESKMVESHTSFGTTEAYFALYNDTITGNRMAFSASDPWEIPCEAMTFSNDYTVMYFTKKTGNREPEKIYEAKYQAAKGGKYDWVSNSKPLSFCSDKSVYTHPALSADGEKLIFSSNRKESTGGLDLFISKKEGNDWSSPENLGILINTTGNELYPFLDQDNNLYFSSDGIAGKGGYDIYFCRYNGKGWDKPLNLSGKINTPEDELAFTISKLDRKSAFFSSRSRKGNRQVELFRVSFRDQYAREGIKDIPGAFNYVAMASMPPEPPKPEPVKQAETAAVPKQETGTSKAASVPASATDKTAAKTPQGQKPAAAATAAAAGTKSASQPPASGAGVVYRVQFVSNTKPKGSYNITFGGKPYRTFEYLYNGAYRSCAGEFSTLSPAINLQNTMKKEGYPDAFVVAFRNNVRVTDPALFKR